MGRKRSQSTEAAWRDRLARFGNSGLTVKDFCRQEGVSDPSFYQWRKRLSEDQQGPQRGRQAGSGIGKPQPFVPVTVSSPGVPPGLAGSLACAEVELPNGIRIRVPAMHTEVLRVAISAGNEACREVG